VNAHLAISHIHHRLEKPQQHSLHVHHIPIAGHGSMIHPHPTPLDVPLDDLGEEGQQLLSALRGCSDDGIVRLEEVVLEVDERLTKGELVGLDVIFAPAFSVQEVRLVDCGLHGLRTAL
jgi:hypothetical protein